MTVYLQHLEGSKKGRVEPFDLARIRIGRMPDNDLRFDSHKDREVSGTHAEIYRQGETFFIEDLKSTNGTYVNGQRVEEPTPISDGDIIEFSAHGPKVIFCTREPVVEAAAGEEDVGSPRTIVVERGELGGSTPGSKTLGMMINDAMLEAKSGRGGRLGGTGIFARELFKQASLYSSRRQRLAIMSLAVLLVLILVALVYKIGQVRQEAREVQRRQQETIAKQQAELEKFRGLADELKRKGIEAQESQRGISVNLPSVLFQAGKSDLTSEGKENVEQIASVLKEHAAGKKLLVEGHASQEKGVQEEVNRRLSEERAKRIAEALAGYGVAKEQITAKGYGSSRPVASNESEEGRRRNRRVEVVIEK